MEDIKSYGIANWKDWYLLYELEYKLSQVVNKEEREGLSDSEYLYYHKLKNNLRDVVNRLIYVYYDAFSEYIDHHVNYDEFGTLLESDIVRVFGESFFTVFDDLRNAANSEDLQYKIKALNQAKNYTHSYHQHVVTLMGDPGERDIGVDVVKFRWDENMPVWSDDSVLDFYEDLTQGKFIPEWDEEIEKKSSNFNWYTFVKNNDVFDFLGK